MRLWFRAASPELDVRLRAQEERLAKLEEERRRLLAVLESEFRGPLVMLEASSLLALTGDPLRRDEAAQAMGRSTHALNQALEELTELLREEQGELRLEDRVLDLCDLVDTTARAPELQDARMRVSAVLPPGPIWAYGDPERLRRALLGLLRSFRGPRPARSSALLTLVRQPGGRGIEIRVDEQESRPDPARPSLSGVAGGLGVALARRVIAAHGGKLGFQSERGPGFRIWLPEERVAGGADLSLISPAPCRSLCQIP